MLNLFRKHGSAVIRSRCATATRGSPERARATCEGGVIRWRSGAGGMGMGFRVNQRDTIRGHVLRELQENRSDWFELHTASLPILYLQNRMVLAATFIRSRKIGEKVKPD